MLDLSWREARTKMQDLHGNGRKRRMTVRAVGFWMLFSAGVAGSALGQPDDLLHPEQHLTIDTPGVLSDAKALAVYERIRKRMHDAYALAGIPAIAHFGEWRRYNTAPYISATHGQRYVNNYANRTARAYGRFEKAGPLPAGSVLAKDSFTVTDDGEVFSGALFVMEKMPPGFNEESHDWRYTMVMPDGSLVGSTNGEGSERVSFCIRCHERAPAGHHQLFFVPAPYRNDAAVVE
jgi:hypothetical protein